MKNKLFHRPVFHHHSSEHEKKASWLELFYDLVYVASFIVLGNTFSQHIGGLGLVKTFFVFFSFWVSWSAYTYYSNRFTIDDFVHRLSVFLHMFLVVIMTVLIPKVFQEDYTLFLLLNAFSHFLMVALHKRALMQTSYGAGYTSFWMKVFLAAGCVWLIAAFLPHEYQLYGALVSLLMVGGSSILPKARSLMEEFPLDQEHISERYGLLTIIVLGESFVKVMTELVQVNQNLSLILHAGFALLITCSIWWIYFDDVADSHLKKQTFALPVWFFSHLPLQMSVVLMGIGIKKAVLSDFWTPLNPKYAFLLMLSLATILISTAFIDMVTKRQNSQVRNNIRVNVRLFSGFVLILLALTSQSFSNFTLLLSALSVMFFQIFIDMMFSPYHVDEMEYKEAERLTLKKMGEKEVKDLTTLEPIRKGVPSELRKDLYYAFINSSWTGVFALIAMGYLLSNFLFALLYMISTHSLGADAMSFSEAFFFSVQTMSTIGYGVLSPKGLFSNLIVTFEAFFGIIAVALTTGAIFNKISRPNSRLLFSDKILLSDFNGTKCLSFRVGNTLGSDIVEAKVNVSVIKPEVTSEGEVFNRVHDLKLIRDSSPYFKLSWSLFHPINEESPLNGCDGSEIQSIMVTLVGHDGSYADKVFSRHIYYPKNIVKDRYFKDILHRMKDGRMMIDYDKFHQLK